MTLWDSILTVLGSLFGPFPVLFLLFLVVVVILVITYEAFSDGEVLTGAIFGGLSFVSIVFFASLVVFIGSNGIGPWSWAPEAL